jgi:natural product precursor
MKSLRFIKKLNLNKRTIINLNKSEMKNSYGGETAYASCMAYPTTVKPPHTCITCTCEEICS